MADIPSELLHIVAAHLDTLSYFSCLRVCRSWSAFFTSYAWRTIDGGTDIWQRFIEHSSLYVSLQKNRHFIRGLVIRQRKLLLFALAARLTEITSLVVIGPFGDGDDSPQHRKYPLNQIRLAIPESAFRPQKQPNFLAVLHQSRLCWQLVLDNPGLTKLDFRDAPICKAASMARSPELRASWLHIFKGLRDARYLEMRNGDDEVLSKLGSFYPKIEHFGHWGQSGGALDTMEMGYSKTLRVLELKNAVRYRHYREIIMAFPNLQRLHVERCTSPLEVNSAALEEFVHAKLEVLKIQDPSDLRLVKVRFSNIRKIHSGVFDASLAENLVESQPTLEHLILTCPQYYTTFYRPNVGPTELPRPSVGLKEFEWTGQHRSNCMNMSMLLPRLSHLVRLDIGIIMASDFEIIPRTCHLLEHMQFDLQGRAYQGMGDLFTKCPYLKTCLGLNHVIRASDMTDNLQPWTCLGIQELDLEIFDVDRLSREEERILDVMQIEGRTEPKDEQEQSAISSRELSTENQSLVCRRLGRCTELTHLHLGVEVHTTYLGSMEASEVTTHFKSQLAGGMSYRGLREGPVYSKTLELSLESGLAELGTLRGLEDLGLSYVNHRIGVDEMEWMSQNWSLKVVSGIWGYYTRGNQDADNINERAGSFLNLIPDHDSDTNTR
ncbi:hypothetical protein BGZ96_003087 [Linnemannia gamsii]|uniref:F-box domain-containing protein n=1 Tax=Linnemannia gamsii TaxID=64522 RepID=A0ABQ7K8C7_9FUNG|nr:hypothetical protein BGZ96_003087 [Linnemannia gamsii]